MVEDASECLPCPTNEYRTNCSKTSNGTCSGCPKSIDVCDSGQYNQCGIRAPTYNDSVNCQAHDCEKIGDFADLGFSSRCDFEKQLCSDVGQLVDYFSLLFCTESPPSPWLYYLLLLIWLGLLISLLATTADIFFMPPLFYLSEKLDLSPSVSGVTLLALGNGAPDVFTALAGLEGGRLDLALTALVGASICISSFVLGFVIILSPPLATPEQLEQHYRLQEQRGSAMSTKLGFSTKTVKRKDFLRDVSAYVIAFAVIVGVCIDLKIYLYESIMFLVLYCGYVCVVVRSTRKENKQLRESNRLMYSTPLVDDSAAADEGDADVLDGLTWPSEAGVGVKLQYVLELPFSVLRWLTVPSTNLQWSATRRWLSVLSPFPFCLLFSVMCVNSFDGLTNTVQISSHQVPWVALYAAGSAVLSVVLLCTTTSSQQPPAPVRTLFAVMAFAGAVAWLNVLANEVVAVLETLGVLWNVSASILGLTVLAMGNSVGDFVADTTVTLNGSPATAVATCFGSPLLNDVVGLGLSLTVVCLKAFPEPFTFTLCPQVYVAWGFLALTLGSSVVVFPATGYWPPKAYGVYLVCLYIVFVITSIIISVYTKNGGC